MTRPSRPSLTAARILPVLVAFVKQRPTENLAQAVSNPWLDFAQTLFWRYDFNFAPMPHDEQHNRNDNQAGRDHLRGW